MAPVTSLFFGLLLSLHATAHFILQYPPSLGFDDDTEGTAPCGGFPVKFNASDADAQVDGFPVSMLSVHPAADWLFRGTLDQKAPFNWTDLLPVVSETGLGQFCIPDIKAPTSWSGKQGLVQVIQHGPDGILYQCAAVNFVTGSNTTVSSSCTNVTGLTATTTTNDTNFFSTASSSSSMASSTVSSTASGSAVHASSSGIAAGLTVPGVWTSLFGAASFAGALLAV